VGNPDKSLLSGQHVRQGGQVDYNILELSSGRAAQAETWHYLQGHDPGVDVMQVVTAVRSARPPVVGIGYVGQAPVVRTPMYGDITQYGLMGPVAAVYEHELLVAQVLAAFDERLAEAEERIVARLRAELSTPRAEAEPAEIGDAEIKVAVARFFKEHDGGVFDAEDVARALGFSIGAVIDVLDQLEDEGGVRVVERKEEDAA